MTILTGYKRTCWLCLVELAADNTAHICPSCAAQEAKLAALAKPASVKSCPECGATLETCLYPDFHGRLWYWCPNCDCYWHQDDLALMSELTNWQAAGANDLERAAEHADWLDNQRTLQGLRQDLY